MTLEREIHADVRAMLMANQPFEYAHLIKFERPSRPDSLTGKTSTASVRYTHLTDASRDIGFDDGSKDLNGVSNGSQTYLANKILKVSEVSESVEAKASNYTLTLDGNGIGAELGAQNMTVTVVSTGVYDIEILDKLVDPIFQGFREGDKIELYGGLTGSFNIDTFRSNNIVRVKKIDTTLTAGTYSVGFKLSSEEIKSILLDKNGANYSSFINREVFIYRLYQQNGATVGNPILLFKGIISNVSFDDGDKGIQVAWGLTSHWGDFGQVKGRISSDDFHRALDQNGYPQPASALKPEYAYDKGFIHSETSVNMLAKYVVQVEKQKIKSKKGFLGIGSKVKVKKYMVNEDRFTELDLQLAARSIPLHYGVRTTEGFPIFADTLNNDSSTVYVIYALGEGPIRAIYDIIVEGKSLICSNKSDLDARGAQTADDTVDLVCRGRADRGDVLGGQVSVNGAAAPVDYYASEPEVAYSGTGLFGNLLQRVNFQPYLEPTTAGSGYTSDGRGIIAGESLKLTSPIDMTLDFFGGTEGQAAASQLVALSASKSFKIQNDYWMGSDTAEYWGPNHRLLDTAYAMVKYKISEGETTLPTLEFILHSKVIECYNYDFSYAHSTKNTGENPNNFTLGATVNLYRSDNNALINSSVQIIDKWTFVRMDGTLETRFRFSTPPALGYVDGAPTITKFYMSSGGNNWTMTTFNYVEYSGTIGEALTIDATATNVGGTAEINAPAPINLAVLPVYSPPDEFASYLTTGMYSNGRLQTRAAFNDYQYINAQ